jgi:hypothetical protein
MDEASKFLEDMTLSQPQLPSAYCKITLEPHLVDGMINLVPSSINLVDPFPPFDPIIPLGDATQVVDLISPSVDLTLRSRVNLILPTFFSLI